MTRARAPARRPAVLLAVRSAAVADVFLDVIRELLSAGASVAVVAVEDPHDDAEWRNVLELGEPGALTILETPRWSSLGASWAAVRGLLDIGRYYADAYANVPIHRLRYEDLLRRQASARGRTTRHLVDVLLWLVDRRASRGPTLAALRGGLRVLPAPAGMRKLVGDATPAVVVVSPLVEFASPLSAYVRIASRRRIPTVALVASWDQLTSKGGLEPAPDLALVWNETQRRELLELHGVELERSRATGAPRYDRWMARSPRRDRPTLLRDLGLPETELVLCYAASSPFIGAHEPAFVTRWLSALREASSDRLRNASVIVRPHPQARLAWCDADYGAFGGVAVFPREPPIPSRDEAAAQDFFDTLASVDAVVGLSTSAFLDAGTLGKPSFTVLDQDFAETQRLLHLNLISVGEGCLHTAASLEEHVSQLTQFVADPEPAGRAARAFTLEFLGYESARPSSIRTAGAILELVTSRAARVARGREAVEQPARGRRARESRAGSRADERREA